MLSYMCDNIPTEVHKVAVYLIDKVQQMLLKYLKVARIFYNVVLKTIRKCGHGRNVHCKH